MKQTTKIQRKNWQSSSTEKWENEKEIEVCERESDIIYKIYEQTEDDNALKKSQSIK